MSLKIECQSKWISLIKECHWRWNVTQNKMSLKMECHTKWNVTKKECLLKWNVTQNVMTLKIKFHSKWKGTQNGISLEMECHWKWIITQNRMSLKMELHSQWNVTQMECHSKLNFTQNCITPGTKTCLCFFSCVLRFYVFSWNISHTFDIDMLQMSFTHEETLIWGCICNVCGKKFKIK